MTRGPYDTDNIFKVMGSKVKVRYFRKCTFPAEAYRSTVRRRRAFSSDHIWNNTAVFHWLSALQHSAAPYSHKHGCDGFIDQSNGFRNQKCQEPLLYTQERSQQDPDLTTKIFTQSRYTTEYPQTTIWSQSPRHVSVFVKKHFITHLNNSLWKSRDSTVRWMLLNSEVDYRSIPLRYQQDAQLSQRDRAAGCVIVFAKSRTLELGDNDLRTL